MAPNRRKADRDWQKYRPIVVRSPAEGLISQTAARKALQVLFKAEYAYDMGMPQWMARLDSALSSCHLERLFLGRHKIFHFRSWYRDALAGYLREMLLDRCSLSRSYIQRGGLERIVRRHISGAWNYTTDIHRALSLELFHRLFIDGTCQPPTNNERLQAAMTS